MSAGLGLDGFVDVARVVRGREGALNDDQITPVRQRVNLNGQGERATSIFGFHLGHWPVVGAFDGIRGQQRDAGAVVSWT